MLTRGVLASPATVMFRNSTAPLAGTWIPNRGRRKNGPELERELHSSVLIVDFNLIGSSVWISTSGQRPRAMVRWMFRRSSVFPAFDRRSATHGWCRAGIEKDTPVVSGVNIAEHESEASSVSGGQSKLRGEFGRGPRRGVQPSEGFLRRTGAVGTFSRPTEATVMPPALPWATLQPSGVAPTSMLREVQFAFTHRVGKVVCLDMLVQLPPFRRY